MSGPALQRRGENANCMAPLPAAERGALATRRARPSWQAEDRLGAADASVGGLV
jgi:hypothetical protein